MAGYDYANLCDESIQTITGTCKKCQVDFDRKKKDFIPSANKGFKYAVIGIIRKNGSIEDDDVYLLPVSELSSTKETILRFDTTDNRASKNWEKILDDLEFGGVIMRKLLIQV